METEVSQVRQALYRGDRVAAEALVAAGAQLYVFDAAAIGDCYRLQELLDADASLAHEWSADGFTALHFAAYLGGAAPVRILLDAGADPNAAQQGGYTPLDEALITKNEPLAALLRERGAHLSGNPLPG